MEEEDDLSRIPRDLVDDSLNGMRCGRHDDAHFVGDELRELRQLIEPTFCPTVVDHDALALIVTKRTQPLPERRYAAAA